MTAVVKMAGITKAFPGVVANDGVDFELEKGEIHALLGENGAGKTTLMNILYGLLRPDSGDIYVRGEKVMISSPLKAVHLGIGMVHQHFTLIPSLTVLENIVLGLRSSREPFVDAARAIAQVRPLAGQYGLSVSLKTRVGHLSVGTQQRVEIIKALYRTSEILILDEPTAVLTPPETEELFGILRSLAQQGRAIVFITHRLQEVMTISHHVTVLRDGRVMGRVTTAQTTPRDLARMMVGREVLFRLQKPPMPPGEVVLEVRDLWVADSQGLPVVRGVSLSVRRGEVLGLAGVDGNGQKELAEAITRLRRTSRGQVLINGRDVTQGSPQDFLNQRAAYIPGDRHGAGLILDFTVAENLILKSYSMPPFRKGLFLDHDAIRRHARQAITRYGVRTSGPEQAARLLSGGNQQKVILARELDRELQLLVIAQPTRGLDVGATEEIHRRLLEQRRRGVAILLISADLEEVMRLSDRIAVLYEGKILGNLRVEEVDVQDIGLMMMGSKGDASGSAPAVR